MAALAEQTRNAFDFIEKLYVETSYLVKEVEGHLQGEPEDFIIGRPSGYGVTMLGSSGLETANVRKWLRKSFVVFFRPRDKTRLRSGTTTTAFGTNVLILLVDYLDKDSGEPVIVAACIRNIKCKYKLWKKFEHMLWIFADRPDSIFGAEPEIDYEDGVSSFKGKFFRRKLFSMTSGDDIREKLVQPMLKLYRA